MRYFIQLFMSIMVLGGSPVLLAQEKMRLPLKAVDLPSREDGSLIRYYQQSPVNSEGQASESLLLLIQGSGCQSVANQSATMQKMAEILPESDIVWVEKRGLEAITKSGITDESCPLGYYQHESVWQRVQDYQQVIQALSSQYTNITILGGSEGATIVGLLLLADLPINQAIALNGGGQYFFDDVLWSIEKTVQEPDRTSVLAGIKSFAEYILVMTEEELRQDQDYSSNHSARWWQEMLSLDMQEVWVKGKTPLLMVQTLGDNNVSVVSAEALFQELEKYPHITTLTFPALDHGFKDAKGNIHVEVIIAEIQRWLQTL